MLFCILGVNTSGNQNPKTRTLATPPSTGMQRKFQKQTKIIKTFVIFGQTKMSRDKLLLGENVLKLREVVKCTGVRKIEFSEHMLDTKPPSLHPRRHTTGGFITHICLVLTNLMCNIIWHIVFMFLPLICGPVKGFSLFVWAPFSIPTLSGLITHANSWRLREAPFWQLPPIRKNPPGLYLYKKMGMA